jgi:predicted O-methyltransferase YrrM
MDCSHPSISAYGQDVFGCEDQALRDLRAASAAAGLPDIAINSEVGRLLQIITASTPGKLAIEIGTLAGYSGMWIVRGLSLSGHLHTLEANPVHAQFAQQQFARAGVHDRVTIHRGQALDLLPGLAAELGERSVDVVFLDAVKQEYPAYWRLVRPLIRTGGFIVADNIYGSNEWSISDVDHPARQGADALNRAVAGDADFAAVGIPLRQGVLIGRRMR